jgi:diguanylate cyclase (GGDEF)-like protein
MQFFPEQLLELSLAASAPVFLAVAGVFALVFRATKRSRGVGWMWGWALAGAAFCIAAAALRFPAHQTLLTLAATLAAVGASFCSAWAAYDFGQGRRVPPAVYVFLAAWGALTVIVWSRFNLAEPLLGCEFGACAATVVSVAGLLPLLKDPRRRGLQTVCAFAVLVTLLTARTLVNAAILSFSGRALTPLYWTAEVLGGSILAFLLSMGELVAILDEVRLEVDEFHASLNGALLRLESAATVDPLTGLQNRYAFYALVEELARLAEPPSGAIAILDLNNLKNINDTFGHHAGDRALLNVAMRLRETIRATDRVFRWGGDEFVALLFDMPVEAAKERLSRMPPPEPLSIVNRQLPVPLSVSWGVAALRSDIDDALRDADEQLYGQKRIVKEAAQRVTSA